MNYRDTGGFSHIRVDCYSGYRGEETPRRFEIGNRFMEIIDVIDRWAGPDHRYFKVLGEDNAVYILRHDTVSCFWELSFYRAPNETGKF